jgi:hypothetical protein
MGNELGDGLDPRAMISATGLISPTDHFLDSGEINDD